MRILIALALLVASTLAVQAQNRWVTIENFSGVTMREFYASNRDQRTWGRDWLGSQLLYSGQSIDFNIDDGSGYCIYDLKAVFMDGQELTAMGFNVCEQASWSFN